MRRAPAAIALALLLLSICALVPAAVPGSPVPAAFAPAVALAADDIEITTEARYTVDPRDAVVHVVVDITAVNRKPDLVTGTGSTRYFFDGVNLGVQPEAKRLRATQDGAPVDVSAANREGFRLVTLAFPANLYFGETARLRMTFDLPAGEPRSDSDVRVGPAFATFTAWAFGDAGTVRLEVPEAFEVDIAGERMERDGSSGQHRAWTADAADAASWYAWVNATNDDALTRDRLALAEGDEVVIRGWPDDRRWRNLVRELLEDGVPALVERIGLPWPVDGALEVTEVHTPLLEGYAGFYDPETDRITISEDLDDLTIVHEASHAWFNGELFTERWISEGLADEYAARVLGDLGRGTPSPERVGRRDDAAFPLGDWPPPAAIRDEEAGERESWGYGASWQLMRRIMERVGEDGMREVLAAAHAGTVAYPGEGTPEPSRLGNDWRRFLDLVEVAEAGPGGVEAGPDDRSIAGMLEQWVLPGPEKQLLPARAEALEAYAGLVEAGDAWAPPDAVRLALDRWDFADATDLIDQAEGLLEARDTIAAAAALQGLTPDPALEADYQDADSPSELSVLGERTDRSLAALATVFNARVAAAQPRDWIAEMGMDGLDPVAAVAGAGAAWEAGDDAAAESLANRLVASLAAAPDTGRNRLLAIVGAIAAGLLGLLILLLVVRHLRRPRVAVPAVTIEAERPVPYATLPPDATPAPPPGGPAPGDEGADRP